MKKYLAVDTKLLKTALKIWRATQTRVCHLCDRNIMKGEAVKVVVGANKTLTRYYHLRCYINKLKEEVKDYESILELMEAEEKK